MVKAREFLEKCDVWTLTAMQSVTMTAKSFLVGMAVVCGVHHRYRLSKGGSDVGEGANASPPPFWEDLSEAVLASRVEEEFQIDNWGLVEGGHDYDRLNCSIQIHSAVVMLESVYAAAAASDDNNDTSANCDDVNKEE